MGVAYHNPLLSGSLYSCRFAPLPTFIKPRNRKKLMKKFFLIRACKKSSKYFPLFFLHLQIKEADEENTRKLY